MILTKFSERKHVECFEITMNISLIIPTLNAGKEIQTLIELILQQTIIPDEIIIIDSSSDDDTVEIFRSFKEVSLIEIKRKDFNHGGTRDMALRCCRGEIVIFMTQDAVPADNKLIENLLKPFADNTVACTTARQLPKDSASPLERAIRDFNYPSSSFFRTKDDMSTYGIKTFFFSDVCAAYRRDIYLKLGGFERNIKTNEDMFYAAKVIINGYKTAYVSEAAVIHSHNLTIREQYRRNYLIGYELEKRKSLLYGAKVYGEGIKLVKNVICNLYRQKHFLYIIYLLFDCGARLLGNKMGKMSAIKQSF